MAGRASLSSAATAVEPSCLTIGPDQTVFLPAMISALAASTLACTSAGTEAPNGSNTAAPLARLPRTSDGFHVPPLTSATSFSIIGPQFQDTPVSQAFGARS